MIYFTDGFPAEIPPPQEEQLFTDTDLRELISKVNLSNVQSIPSSQITIGPKVNEGSSSIVYR